MSAEPPASSGGAHGEHRDSSPWSVVVPLLVTRMLANLALRFPYTFASTVARGLGVDLETLTRLLGLRELGGLVSPIAGRWSDRGHLSRVAVAAGVTAGLSLVVAAVGGPWSFGAAMAIGGLATFSLYVVQNSWLGHAIPIGRRASVFGIVETAWAGAFLVGVPAIGWVIERWGWQAGFVVVGPAIAVAAIWSGSKLVPPDDADTDEAAEPDRRRVLIPHPAAVAVYVFAQPMTQMLVFAVYGDWFETRLDLSISQVGAATAALGVAELVGTLSTAVISDRLGPARVAWVTLGAAALPLAALSAVGGSAVVGIALVVAIAVLIECSFVSVLPVMTELDPSNRARSIARMTVVITISRGLGAPLAGRLYTAWGITGVAWAACGTALVGAAALAYGTHVRGRSA